MVRIVGRRAGCRRHRRQRTQAADHTTHPLASRPAAGAAPDQVPLRILAALKQPDRLAGAHDARGGVLDAVWRGGPPQEGQLQAGGIGQRALAVVVGEEAARNAGLQPQQRVCRQGLWRGRLPCRHRRRLVVAAGAGAGHEVGQAQLRVHHLALLGRQAQPLLHQCGVHPCEGVGQQWAGVGGSGGRTWIAQGGSMQRVQQGSPGMQRGCPGMAATGTSDPRPLT